MKKVTVYSSKGASNKSFSTMATTWTDLQAAFTTEGIDYKGMRVMVGETRNTLESGKALLPTGNFTIFLSPMKTKSGASFDVENASYKEMRAEIGKILSKDDSADKLFNAGNKNYTNKTKDDMRKMLRKYYNISSNSSVSTKPAKVVKKAINSSSVQTQLDNLSNKIDNLVDKVEVLIKEKDVLAANLEKEANLINEELVEQGLV